MQSSPSHRDEAALSWIVTVRFDGPAVWPYTERMGVAPDDRVIEVRDTRVAKGWLLMKSGSVERDSAVERHSVKRGMTTESDRGEAGILYKFCVIEPCGAQELGAVE